MARGPARGTGAKGALRWVAMSRRNVVSTLIAIICFAAAGVVAYQRYAPGAAAQVLFINMSSEPLALALTVPEGSVHHIRLEPKGQSQSPFAPGSRLDVWPKGDTRAIPVSWVLEEVRGTVEVSMEGESAVIAGTGLKSRPVE